MVCRTDIGQGSLTKIDFLDNGYKVLDGVVSQGFQIPRFKKQEPERSLALLVAPGIIRRDIFTFLLQVIQDISMIRLPGSEWRNLYVFSID